MLFLIVLWVGFYLRSLLCVGDKDFRKALFWMAATCLTSATISTVLSGLYFIDPIAEWMKLAALTFLVLLLYRNIYNSDRDVFMSFARIQHFYFGWIILVPLAYELNPTYIFQ